MADKKLTGKKVLMVIAPMQFRDEELLTPKEILASEGAQITVASTKAGEATGMLGAQVVPDTVIDNVKATDFDAVIVVGGMGSPEFLWDSQVLHGLLKQQFKQGKVVAAICLSGAVLAKSGVLEDKKATVWAMPESLQALQDGKATYLNQHVVVDGQVITADGPEAAADFAQAVVQALQTSPAKV